MPTAPDTDLRGRTALVTGASRGIGLSIARHLADYGMRVVFTARGGQRLEDAAAAAGGRALACDVTDAAAVGALPDRLRSQWGDGVPDVLVNAAGTFGLAPIAATTSEQFERHLAVNLRGPFLMIRTFLPGMLERGAGHVVSIGSVAGRIAFPDNGAYSASKFGLRGLHAVLEQELRGTGVRCTLIEPAATDTPLWDGIDRTVHEGLPGPDRMLTVEAVAEAVLFAVTRSPRTGIGTISMERA